MVTLRVSPAYMICAPQSWSARGARGEARRRPRRLQAPAPARHDRPPPCALSHSFLVPADRSGPRGVGWTPGWASAHVSAGTRLARTARGSVAWGEARCHTCTTPIEFPIPIGIQLGPTERQCLLLPPAGQQKEADSGDG